MASNIPKDRTVAALGEVWASLSDLLGELSDEEWSLPTPLPGWNVQDNVSHIVGTEAMLAGEPGPVSRSTATPISMSATTSVRSTSSGSNRCERYRRLTCWCAFAT